MSDASTVSTNASAREHRVLANGVDHHVLEWLPARPTTAPTVVLCHGFLDIGFSFRACAEALCASGRRVIAFDWRGHGESDWAPPGSYYHFPDYVRDLEELLRWIAPDPSETVDLLGHSMGGTAAALYAGTRPARIRKLVLVEGLGPPEIDLQNAPDRMRAWFAGLDTVSTKTPRPLASLDEALVRMRRQNPEIPDALGLFLAEKSTRPVAGGRAWAFDPRHQTTAPVPFMKQVFLAYLARITAPVLLVNGEHGFRLPDHDERRAALSRSELVTIPGVGHMVHWLAPDELARHTAAFLDAP